MSTENDEKLPSEWRFWWRLLLSLLGLILLVTLIYAEENWRGKRAWEKYRRVWEAKGEKFNRADFIPPRVPDGQNFAMTPLLAPLFDFNPRPLQPGQGLYRDTNSFILSKGIASDVKWTNSSLRWLSGQPLNLPAWAAVFSLKSNQQAKATAALPRTEAAAQLIQSLERYRTVLDEIQEASHRPYSRFNLAYDDANPAGILMPHLPVLLRVASLFELRAAAELAVKRGDAAFDDTMLTLYLADCIRGEPMMTSGLTRLSLLQSALQPLWEGLATHQWSDAQLAGLQQRLEKLDLLADYTTLLRGERAFSLATLDYLRRELNVGRGNAMGGPGSSGIPDEPFFRLAYVMPSGWFYRNQIAVCSNYEDFALHWVDATNHRLLALNFPVTAATQQKPNRAFSPSTGFAALVVHATTSTAIRFATAQTEVDEAIIACALERYRLANGQYPETLDALTPQFIQAIPHDIINGEPLKYRRTDDGKFLLSSAGWHPKDDGAKTNVARGPIPTAGKEQGAWIWPQYPSK